jgi:hypothetical protein
MDYRKKVFIEELRNLTADEFQNLIHRLSNIRDLIEKYPFENDPTYIKHDFISNYLKDFGFSFALDGFYFLRTTLGYMLYETTERVALTQLGKILAKRHNVTPDVFVRGIYNSLSSAYEKNFRLFDCFNCPWQSPSANEFIYRFLYYAKDIQYMLNNLLNSTPGIEKAFSYSAISNYMATFLLPTDQIGYRYIREALHIMLSNENKKAFFFHDVVYQLSRDFQSSADSIKSAMRRCVKAAYEKCPDYFPALDHDSEIPLHCQFLSIAANEWGLVTCSY